MVLLVFALAAWLGAVFELGAADRARDDGLEQATNGGDE
jgi:hypothetical protein